MYTLEDIRVNIVPIPQKVNGGEGAALRLLPTSKFKLTAPVAEKGPIKTAGENMTAFLKSKCGEDCFAEDGVPVTLELGTAPKEVKNPEEGYRIVINAEGVTITGFGAAGLFYGVTSFKQLCKWGSCGVEIPAVEILDWPDSIFRGFKEECRYGSNVMERKDWLEMIDYLAEKKYNRVCIGLYGCWVVQYDGKVAEYLYLPLKEYPQLKTPMRVKYYSPTEGKWYNYETLPPIYRDNLFGEICRYAKDHAIDVIPGINSFGHNTLFPAQIPEVSPKDEEGNPTKTGFCTSSEETYKLLFSVYDQIIDEYMIPNDLNTFNILMDEVWDQFGANAETPRVKLSAWCKCEKCRNQDKGDIFINHAMKILGHMKEKGMKSVIMANDMLVRESSQLGHIGDRMKEIIEREGLEDTLLLGWWRYTDLKETLGFRIMPNDLGLRGVCQPWNGYYIWSLLTHPLRNIKILADMNHEAKLGEGLYAYAIWDRSYDRMDDCLAEYAWNYEGTGELEDMTNRYTARHFGPMQEETAYAYKLMELITEERKGKLSADDPLGSIVSNRALMVNYLSYYPYCYFKADQPYPRHFPGAALEILLKHRADYERAMYGIVSMAKEAKGIFEKAAVTAGCDQAMAERMAYECQNYQVLVEDWLAILKIYDLTQKGDQKKIAPIARARQAARVELMYRCEQIKEDWACKGATMRNHSVFMQNFADIAVYIENTDEPVLDLMDITPIMSKENWMIR